MRLPRILVLIICCLAEAAGRHVSLLCQHARRRRGRALGGDSTTRVCGVCGGRGRLFENGRLSESKKKAGTGRGIENSNSNYAMFSCGRALKRETILYAAGLEDRFSPSNQLLQSTPRPVPITGSGVGP